MDPAKIKAALDAIEKGDEAAALALLKELIASAAGGGEAAAAEGEALAETPEPKPEDDAEKALAALTKRVEARDAAFAALTKRIEAQDAAAAVIELGARRELVADLVKLSVEFPSTAWQQDAKGEPTDTPVKRLLSEPIEELRTRVTALKKLRPLPPTPEPPTTVEVTKLSKIEQEYCTKNGLTPEQFAVKKAGTVRKAK